MVRVCHHHRTTPADVRTWPLVVYLGALQALDEAEHG